MAAFTVISAAELGASAASFTISSISASYDHLYMTISARDSKSAYYNNLEFRFNGDSTPYSCTYLIAQTATPTSSRNTSSEIGDVLTTMAADSTLAVTFSTTTIWIPNYSNTSNDKPCLIKSVVPNNSTTDDQWRVQLTAGLWASTDAIDEIRVKSDGASELMQYTSYVLYGINGA